MANITAKDVAALRERTGVGMMDCKKALVETDGDMEKAIVILREKGLATQQKKSSRAAAEGVVVSKVNADHTAGVVLEINCETDFVAGNDEFRAFVNNVADTIMETNPADVDTLKTTKMINSDLTVDETLQELFLKIRENMQIRRFVKMEGILVPYVHGEGQIGVMVKLQSDAGADNADVLACGKDIALQIAALSPSYLKREDVPATVIENEKEIMKGQMAEDPKMAGKPEQVVAKIIEGKVGKYYIENCLLEQVFVKDGDLNITKYIEGVAKKIGKSISVVEYVRYEKGEGLQKKEDNFADEVAGMMK